MAREIIPHKIEDWSPLVTDEVWTKVDLSIPELNFAIHRYNDKLWSSGYVGVGRLFDKNQHPIISDGKEHILIVTSRFRMDPWEMLEAVMTDDEYEDYVKELESDGKFLFRVFYDQPLIRLAQDSKNDGDLLYALSFITSCFRLCKKGLKKTLFHQEENYVSKVRGKIDVVKNIRKNTCRGRNDRFYCKFIDFTEDNIENRILKATLLKCKSIIKTRFEKCAVINRHLCYCLNAFRGVKSVKIRVSDFNNVSASGLYMYYKPLLRQARSIFSQKYFSYATENGKKLTKSVYTVPYMINMETLFEFYARTILKIILDGSKYKLERYSMKLYLQKYANKTENIEKCIHLISYCIPDIIVCDIKTNMPIIVLDAKYKANTRADRLDSLQLLSYVLLTDVERCGFIFPGAITEVKAMKSSGTDFLLLNPGDLKYYELILGEQHDVGVIEKLFI
jgi:hypothetical protein